MLESIRNDDPELAEQMVEGGKESDAAMTSMINKYAE
jgi:hypothetical protein